MHGALLFTLPEVPDHHRRDTHWWWVVDGEVVEGGNGEEWLTLAERRPSLVAVAPAGSVRLSFAPAPTGATPRQAASIARVAAVQASLGDEETLHAVSDVAPDGTVATAVVDQGVMRGWLVWARELGADPDHVVPAAALLPLSDRWLSAKIGADNVLGRKGIVLPGEPGLTDLVLGSEEVRGLEEAEVHAAIAAAAGSHPLDLRSGRFARQGLSLDRRRARELIVLAALIPLLMLSWMLVSIFKLDRSADRLNAETVSVASGALGRAVTLETAESELAQRSGGSASAYGGLMAPLTATYQAMQQEPGVSSTSIAYSADDTLSVTLAAPTVDPINRVLLALQSDGYKVTAVSRQSPDARQMVDMTVRSAP